MTQTLSAPQHVALPETADPTAGFRRFVGAVALPLGIACQVGANAAYALATAHGGSDSDGASSLELYGREPGLLRLATVLAIVGVLLLITGLPTANRLMRPTRPRLVLVATGLMGAGYFFYAVVNGTNWLTMTLGLQHVDAAAAIDAAQSDPTAMPWFLVFIAGNIGGTFLLGLAVLLSPGLPKLAGILIICWPVSHVTGLMVGSEWFEVAGAALETIGLALLTVAALRMPLPEWLRRG